MNPRYFIAITLPEALSQSITNIQNELYVPGKIMPPLTPHITLLHPNLLETLHPMYFTPKVKKIAEKTLPIEIKLVSTSMFDKRVLHIVVEGPELVVLQQKLAKLLPDQVRAQYTIGKSYIPHVTLLQAKPRQELTISLIQDFERQITSLLPNNFAATSLTIFKWISPRSYNLQSI